jgi:hypothetical protein
MTRGSHRKIGAVQVHLTLPWIIEAWNHGVPLTSSGANRSMNLESCDRASIRLPSAAAVHEAAVQEATVSSSPNILTVDIRLR